MKKAASCWPWLLLSVAVVIIDQIIKAFVIHHLQYDIPDRVTSFLNWTLAYNPGAAFSFLGRQGGWQIYLFSSLSLAISMVLIIWLLRTPRSDRMMAAGISLIIGGAIGNAIDRIRISYVVDYIDFHIGLWHYATFNFADAAICIGAAILLGRLIAKRNN